MIRNEPTLDQTKKRKKGFLPSREVINIADQHLEPASALGGEAGVHLHSHSVGDVLQLRVRGGAVLLEVPHYLHRLHLAVGVPHAAAGDVRRDGDHRGRAGQSRSHFNPPHDVKICKSREEKKKKRKSRQTLREPAPTVFSFLGKFFLGRENHVVCCEETNICAANI